MATWGILDTLKNDMRFIRPFNLGQQATIFTDHETLVDVNVAGGNDISYCIFSDMIYFPLGCFSDWKQFFRSLISKKLLLQNTFVRGMRLLLIFLQGNKGYLYALTLSCWAVTNGYNHLSRPAAFAYWFKYVRPLATTCHERVKDYF